MDTYKNSRSNNTDLKNKLFQEERLYKQYRQMYFSSQPLFLKSVMIRGSKQPEFDEHMERMYRIIEEFFTERKVNMPHDMIPNLITTEPSDYTYVVNRGIGKQNQSQGEHEFFPLNVTKISGYKIAKFDHPNVEDEHLLVGTLMDHNGVEKYFFWVRSFSKEKSVQTRLYICDTYNNLVSCTIAPKYRELLGIVRSSK